MKEEVKQWLTTGQSWNDGLALMARVTYLSHFRSVCLRQGASKSNRRAMEYQLCKIAGISGKDAEKLKAGYKAAPVATDTMRTPIAMIQETARLNNESKKIRQEFPFLMDPGCPDELKILVADKITAYYKYCEAHEKLNGELEHSRDVVENWLENRLIYKELNYYKKHKKPLMEHPIWEQMKREKEIGKMNVVALVALMKNLNMNIWRNKKQLEKEPDSDLTHERRERIKNYEFELKIVERLLNAK
jgi:hypothetical protein